MLIILYLCQPDQYVYLFGDVLDLKGLRLTQTVLFSYFFAFFTRKCENANLGDLPDRGGQGSSIKIFPATKIGKFNVGYHKNLRYLIHVLKSTRYFLSICLSKLSGQSVGLEIQRARVRIQNQLIIFCCCFIRYLFYGGFTLQTLAKLTNHSH
uniref:Uncharacterized protein n=1 Tax=Cacopsylla melanoneura TaxID=428564 RepID=A0A8D8TV87_9HEMI